MYCVQCRPGCRLLLLPRCCGTHVFLLTRFVICTPLLHIPFLLSFGTSLGGILLLFHPDMRARYHNNCGVLLRDGLPVSTKFYFEPWDLQVYRVTVWQNRSYDMYNVYDGCNVYLWDCESIKSPLFFSPTANCQLTKPSSDTSGFRSDFFGRLVQAFKLEKYVAKG